MPLPMARRMLTVSAATAALASAAVAIPSPAQSEAELTIASWRCVNDPAMRWWIRCDMSWAGGTDPATVQWNRGINSSIDASGTDPAAHQSWATGSCFPSPTWPFLNNSIYSVSVTITDAAGQSLARSLLGTCPLRPVP